MTDGARMGASLILDVPGGTPMTEERSPAAQLHETLKLAEVCTRCAKRKPEPDCLLCRKCRKQQQERTRRSMRKRRRLLKRKGLCTRCGGKKLKAGPSAGSCPRCLVELGQLAMVRVNRNVNRGRGWEARAEGDGYARNRYRGQGKRGRQSAERLDGQDRRDVQRCIDHGFEGLAYFRTEEIQLLPRTQRDDVKAASLAELWRARRFIDDVLARNRFVRPKVDGPNLDEDDQE